MRALLRALPPRRSDVVATPFASGGIGITTRDDATALAGAMRVGAESRAATTGAELSDEEIGFLYEAKGD